MTNRLYEKGARAAYKNCLALFREAVILYNHKKYARGYALAALSCEEFAKAFLYKCIGCGFVVDSYVHDIDKHELKLAHLAHILSTAYALTTIRDELDRAQKHDRKFKDHSKHIWPKVYDKMKKLDTKPLVYLLQWAHRQKMLALYVDIKDGKLHTPNFIKKEFCHKFLHIVADHLGGFNAILNETPAEFRETVQVLDPDILKKGTLKFDFMPRSYFVTK